MSISKIIELLRKTKYNNNIFNNKGEPVVIIDDEGEEYFHFLMDLLEINDDNFGFSDGFNKLVKKLFVNEKDIRNDLYSQYEKEFELLNEYLTPKVLKKINIDNSEVKQNKEEMMALFNNLHRYSNLVIYKEKICYLVPLKNIEENLDSDENLEPFDIVQYIKEDYIGNMEANWESVIDELKNKGNNKFFNDFKNKHNKIYTTISNNYSIDENIAFEISFFILFQENLIKK